MKHNLDYYDKKQNQSLILWTILWISGFPLFIKEILNFTAQYFWLNIGYLLILISTLGLLIFFTIKTWELMTNKKLRMQLFDEYAKENHYKVIKVSAITSFLLTYLFYYVEWLHDLPVKTILGIIIYFTGVTLFGGLAILNRK